MTFDKKTYDKEYYISHKEKKKSESRKRHYEKRDVILPQMSKRGKEYRKTHKYVSDAERKRLRIDVISHYGGKCACCGEPTLEFLAIDHINGGGNKHRQEINRKGMAFYRWLRMNDYPSGYRVLCHNCNCARGYYGYCPHEKQN